MKNFLIFLCIILVGSVSCTTEPDKDDDAVENGIQEISAGGSKISDIIRNPIDADLSVDTINIAKMVFEEEIYRFGKVDEGDIVKHSFKFVNDGKVPLIITNARSTCGCTVPNWPKEAIAPGESGQIDVRFDTKNKVGQQAKPITLTANTYPQSTVLKMVGTVMEEK